MSPTAPEVSSPAPSAAIASSTGLSANNATHTVRLSLPLAWNSTPEAISFRSNATIAAYRALYASVVISRVSIFIAQVSIADPENNKVFPVLSFGLAPSGISLNPSKDGTLLVSPHFSSVLASDPSPVSVQHVWGQGGTPFPPGMQLDLVGNSLKFGFAEFVWGHSTTPISNSKQAWLAFVDVTVSLSGNNF